MADRLVTLRSFDLSWEAGLCALFLEQEGIRAFVNEERSATINYFWTIALGGIKLQVAESDVEKARAVLAPVRIISDRSRLLIKIFARVLLAIVFGFWIGSAILMALHS